MDRLRVIVISEKDNTQLGNTVEFNLDLTDNGNYVAMLQLQINELIHTHLTNLGKVP